MDGASLKVETKRDEEKTSWTKGHVYVVTRGRKGYSNSWRLSKGRNQTGRKKNLLDEGICLCCNSGKEGLLEYLQEVYECDAFMNEHPLIPGTIEGNESLEVRVRSGL